MYIDHFFLFVVMFLCALCGYLSGWILGRKNLGDQIREEIQDRADAEAEAAGEEEDGSGDEWKRKLG